MIYRVTNHTREFIPLKYEMKASPQLPHQLALHLIIWAAKACLFINFFFLKSPIRISDECLRRQPKDVA